VRYQQLEARVGVWSSNPGVRKYPELASDSEGRSMQKELPPVKYGAPSPPKIKNFLSINQSFNLRIS